MSLFPVVRSFEQLGITKETLIKIGSGAEREVFVDDVKPGLIIKLSKRSASLQSKREIDFYRFLFRHKIPLTHLPVLYAVIKTREYIGLIQENIGSVVASDGHTVLKTIELPEFLQSGAFDAAKLRAAFAELKAYLIHYNLVVSDILPHNLKVRVYPDFYRIFLIDGYGSHLFLPLDLYIRSVGQKHILKNWNKMASFIRQGFSFDIDA